MNLSPDLKHLGAYYTPHEVAKYLVEWATAGNPKAETLDPSCGDGRFIEGLPNAVGIDLHRGAVKTARDRCPKAKIVEADFFEWAGTNEKRFDAAVGNPPFIRYQRFTGQARDRALRHCETQGVSLSGLSSSWAPFVAAASAALKPGGRLAFVVPGEIAHAVYARPLLRFLLDSFDHIEVLAFRDKLFRHLSEDCWLLRADGYRGKANELTLTSAHRFDSPRVSSNSETLSVRDLEGEGFRLRPFLLPERIRREYLRLRTSDKVSRLGAVTDLGIGSDLLTSGKMRWPQFQ